MMAVETTCAPHIATSRKATGVPILSAVLRIDASNLCSSRRRQSWPFLAQQKYSIRRLTTAQASSCPKARTEDAVLWNQKRVEDHVQHAHDGV